MMIEWQLQLNLLLAPLSSPSELSRSLIVKFQFFSRMPSLTKIGVSTKIFFPATLNKFSLSQIDASGKLGLAESSAARKFDTKVAKLLSEVAQKEATL